MHSFSAILRALAAAKTDFVLVGGLSAVLRGAPMNTFDVDIVHSRDPQNLDRLVTVLESLGAIFRMQPSRRLKPALSHLAGKGHLNLITSFGPLDLLGTVGEGLGYPELLPFSSEMMISHGIAIRVLELEKYIQLKEQMNGEKDRAVLPILRRTLQESEKKKN